MRKALYLSALAAFVIGLMSCAPTAAVTSGEGPSIAEAQAERYDGPKARLAVGEFTDKTAKGEGNSGWFGLYGFHFKEIGSGMREMLTTALFNSNRYIVLERQQLDEVLKEQDLAAAGRVKKETAAPTGEIYGADLIITAAVTEFEGSAKGVGGGTRVLGVTVGGGLKKSHLAIDVRIIDAKTSQIVAAATVTGSATSVGALGGANIGGRLPVALGGFSKTPTEQAIRTCIQKAVEYIVTKTPAEYYRQK
ncbi:MAG TPA: CsgG/HfaB family protein [Candidatus Desulfaltia sp.]|nr:CsgG/HfaB family protein [Candidatus Desulfaltia sp.]